MNAGVKVIRCRLVIGAAAAVLVILPIMPGSAQMRTQVKNKIIDDAANTIVSQIQAESCSDFAATLQKSRSRGSSSDRASSMLKNDPAARARFVNQVAGPLVNKMIDCDLLPKR